MGKRELLLLVVFVVLGIVVYEVSAPAAPADAPGFSLSRVIQMARSHFSGPAVRRTITKTATLAPSADVTTLSVGETRGIVAIEGTDRTDIQVRLEAVLGGLDEADVTRQERAFKLDVIVEGAVAAVTVASDDLSRRPRYELRVEMPRRLLARLTGRGTADVRNIAGLELDEYRGEVTTDALTGPVTGKLRDGRAEFGPGATLDLETERGRLRADAPASVTLTSAHATIDIVDPAGPVTIEQEQCRIDVRGTGGLVKVTGEGGTIDLRQVAHPLTIEADRLTVSAEFEQPVASTIAIQNDDIEISLPRAGGLQLDAAVTDGDLRLPDGLTSTRTDSRESFSGAVGGGGPLLKVTLDRGALRIRARAPQPGT